MGSCPDAGESFRGKEKKQQTSKRPAAAAAHASQSQPDSLPLSHPHFTHFRCVPTCAHTNRRALGSRRAAAPHCSRAESRSGRGSGAAARVLLPCHNLLARLCATCARHGATCSSGRCSLLIADVRGLCVSLYCLFASFCPCSHVVSSLSARCSACHLGGYRQDPLARQGQSSKRNRRTNKRCHRQPT